MSLRLPQVAQHSPGLPQLGRIAYSPGDLQSDQEFLSCLRELTLGQEDLSPKTTGLDDVFLAVAPLGQCQALVGVGQGPGAIAAYQPQLATTVKEVLRVAPEQLPLLRAGMADDPLDLKQARLGLVETAHSHQVVGEVNQGVTLGLRVGKACLSGCFNPRSFQAIACSRYCISP